MKICGHPVHIMLIHFPSAIFPLDFFHSLYAFYYPNKIIFNEASFVSILIGVLIGWLAAITGCLDVVSAIKNKPSSYKRIFIHAGVNVFVLTGYSFIIMIGLNRYPAIISDDLYMICVKALLIGLMLIGNYYGGNLILKDKILEEK